MFRHMILKTSPRLIRSWSWCKCNGLPQEFEFVRNDLVLRFASTNFTTSTRYLISSQRLSTIVTHPKCLSQPASPTTLHWRQFFGVTVAFNQVDPERVRLAGADRAAAEWVLRNGGVIKWKDAQRSLEDYNLLPSTDFEKFKLEDIDLSATDVIGLGFQHLEHLKHIKSVKLHGCRTIMNDALEHLHFVKDTLEWLEVSRCPMITEKGLENLLTLKNLKTLVIYDLIELKNFDEAISRLRQTMPWCTIVSEDPLTINPDEKESPK